MKLNFARFPEKGYRERAAPLPVEGSRLGPAHLARNPEVTPHSDGVDAPLPRVPMCAG